MRVHGQATLRMFAAMTVLGAGCLPGNATVTVYGDAASLFDASGHEPGITLIDHGAGSSEITVGSDSKQPRQDTVAATPQPPFGTTVGVTAKDFSGIPDCSDKQYRLYDYYQKTRGVVLHLVSPS
jgi:hypothetical protein